jgi:hypothetical protein
MCGGADAGLQGAIGAEVHDRADARSQDGKTPDQPGRHANAL